jgi:hypothetical protein
LRPPQPAQDGSGGADRAQQPRSHPRGGDQEPGRALFELGEAAAQGAHFGVLADQQVAQPQDLLPAVRQLLAQLGELLVLGRSGFTDLSGSAIGWRV